MNPILIGKQNEVIAGQTGCRRDNQLVAERTGSSGTRVTEHHQSVPDAQTWCRNQTDYWGRVAGTR